MNRQQIMDDCKKYTIFTWVAQKSYTPPMCIERAEGVYLYDYDGSKWYDMSSQMENVNIGHGNKAIIKAIQEQAEQLPFLGPRYAYDKRAELGKILIEEIAPKNMQKVLFTLAGADANEYALRMAKAYTGKNKVFSKYESYHGSTYGAGGLTGEAARSSPFPTISGLIKFVAPHPYSYDIKFKTEEEATAHFLHQLEYMIKMEGKNDVAAIFLETVTGSNGVYLYPKGYLKGVRDLCDKYGILLVCDEIMCGFLRCGEWFACQAEGVEPDMITFAKGVNSGYVPLGGVLVSDKLCEFFENVALPCGLTYNSHPMSVASGIASIREMQRLNLKGHVNDITPKFTQLMQQMQEKHPSVADARNKGLLGALEVVPCEDSVFAQMTKIMFEHKLCPICRNPIIMVAPPLIITPDEMDELFSVIDKALDDCDKLVK